MDINSNTAKVIDFSTASELEKIKTYIKNTGMPENVRYDVSSYQFQLLGDMAYHGDIFRAIYFAIRYGQAKGYRQAKAEQRKANNL